MPTPPGYQESNSSGSPEAAPPWDTIAHDPDFVHLLKKKAAFVIPATIFFLIYYFALPTLVGWFPAVMEQRVWGSVNLAYLFALSQFIMAWAIAFLYVAVAADWDRQAAAIIRKFTGQS